MDAAAAQADLVFAREIRELPIIFQRMVDLHEMGGGVEDFLRVDAGDGAATTLRAMSPQAPLVLNPTLWISEKIVGTSSIRSQWNWMVSRVVMSEKPCPKRSAISASFAACADVSRPPGMRCDHEIARILRLLAIDAVPLHTIEVVGVNRGETSLGVAINVVDDLQAVLSSFIFSCGVRGIDLA